MCPKFLSFELLAIVSVVLTPFCLKAQTDSNWNGSVGNWSNASNWSTSDFPNNGNGGQDFNAFIDGGSVTLDSDIAVEGFYLSGGDLITTGRTLTVEADSVWSGGNILFEGTTIFNGELVISGAGTKFLSGNPVFINGGSLLWTDGILDTGFAGVATINNLKGAIFDTDFDGSILSVSGDLPFNNSGTFIKSGGTGTTSFIGNARFNNSGIVNIESGTLELQASGTSSGEFNVDDGATIEFSGGTHDLNSGASISGDGQMIVLK